MARGSIVKRRSGNYAIVYYVDGKQKWETIGPSRREAERALTARKREVDTGTWREPSGETVALYAERWLAQRDPARVKGGRTRLARSTFAEYRRALSIHVCPRLGARTLGSLRTEDVDRLIADLEAEGKAPGTVRNAVVPLRKMLADAVRQGLLVSNPATRADLPPAQDFAGKEIPAAHTDAIRRALRELAAVDPLRHEPDLFFVCLFDVALGTGLRLGELRALRWSDVDRERRLIRVERRTRVRSSGVPRPSRVCARCHFCPRSRRPSASWRPARSSGDATRRRSSSSRTCAVRRSSRPTSGNGSGALRFGWPTWMRRAIGPRLAPHLCFAAGRRRRGRQARPGCRGSRQSAHTLKRYAHLLDARVTEAADRFDPGHVREVDTQAP